MAIQALKIRALLARLQSAACLTNCELGIVLLLTDLFKAADFTAVRITWNTDLFKSETPFPQILVPTARTQTGHA